MPDLFEGVAVNSPVSTFMNGTADGRPLTMSSREIAELTGKLHKNVVRDTRTMLSGLYGEETTSAFEKDGSVLSHERIQGVTWTRDHRGYVEAFHLDKSHTMTLVAGYDVRVRKRIVDRWLELEGPASLASRRRRSASVGARPATWRLCYHKIDLHLP